MGLPQRQKNQVELRLTIVCVCERVLGWVLGGVVHEEEVIVEVEQEVVVMVLIVKMPRQKRHLCIVVQFRPYTTTITNTNK